MLSAICFIGTLKMCTRAKHSQCTRLLSSSSSPPSPAHTRICVQRISVVLRPGNRISKPIGNTYSGHFPFQILCSTKKLSNLDDLMYTRYKFYVTYKTFEIMEVNKSILSYFPPIAFSKNTPNMKEIRKYINRVAYWHYY